jgi:hypothetical protein
MNIHCSACGAPLPHSAKYLASEQAALARTDARLKDLQRNSR